VIVAMNATAYDGRPSGARNRAVGLAAALLRAGARVRMYSAPGIWLRTAVAHEHGGVFPEDRFEHVATTFDSSTTLLRVTRTRAWLDYHVTRDTDVFVTDYYPVIAKFPTFVTVHDLRYHVAREFEPTVRAAAFRALFRRMSRGAAGIVAPTAAVAAQARRSLDLDAIVVGNGLSRAWRDAAPSEGARRHLLMIGFAERRKDLATALAALRRSPDAPPLVVAGRGRPPRDAMDLVVEGRVRFLGDVGDAELVELCRGAAALLHPSRYEGFGMPVIEAMSLGVPVLAARCDAVDEVAGGFATLLPPGDVDAWAAAIKAVAPPAAQARDHARSFTWDAAADRLLAAADLSPSS
jgi:glycosyltransferase involved in cell wall biosynthesis